MFDRAGRGLHTSPRPLALSLCVEAHCSARARLLYSSSEECPSAFLPATENWALPFETALSITSKDHWTTHIKRTVFQSWKIFFFSGARKTSLLSVRPLLAVSMEYAFLSPKIFRISLFSSVWCCVFFFKWMLCVFFYFVFFFISLNFFFFLLHGRLRSAAPTMLASYHNISIDARRAVLYRPPPLVLAPIWDKCVRNYTGAAIFLLHILILNPDKQSTPSCWVGTW